MQQKLFSLLFFLLFGAFSHATIIPVTPTAQMEYAIPQVDCDILAPDNFQIDAVGSTWVSLRWDYQNDALGGYRIRTYRTSDGVLVNTDLKAQNQLSTVIQGLTPGTEYLFVINSRCDNLVDSDQKKSVGPVFTIIGELIVNFSPAPSASSFDCTIDAATSSPSSPGAGTYCSLFNPVTTLTKFKIEGGSQSRLFGLSLNNTSFQCVEWGCNSSDLHLESNLSSGCPNSTAAASAVNAFSNGILVATFEVANGPSTNVNIVCTFLRSGYTIQRNYPTIAPPRGLHDADLLTTSPNPFSENLEVALNLVPQAPVLVHVYNLSGQVVLQRRVDTQQEQQFSLPTANLVPGFYLLRVEVDGNVQTIKVVKAN